MQISLEDSTLRAGEGSIFEHTFWKLAAGQHRAIVGPTGSGKSTLARRVHLLSHGESRKVFLAHLLLRSPHLLILDDLFTGLDQESRARLWSGIEGLLASSRREDIPNSITHRLSIADGAVQLSGKK